MRALLLVLALGFACIACTVPPPPKEGPVVFKVDDVPLERPLLVGTQTEIDMFGLTAHVEHTVSSSNPGVISVSATSTDLTPSACPFLGCSLVAHFEAHVHAEGTTVISLFNARGLVATLPLAAHPASNVALRVWHNSDRILPSDDEPPTFTLTSGETFQLGWDLLDTADEPLVGTQAIDFSSSDETVLSVANILGAAFSVVAVLPGSAELTATTGDIQVPFEFVVASGI